MFRGEEIIKMELVEYLGQTVRVTFKDGQILSGKIVDYTSSADNDDEGEYLTIRPQSGKLKGQPIVFYKGDFNQIVIK